MSKQEEELQEKSMKTVVYDLLLGVQMTSRNLMEEKLKQFTCPIHLISTALESVSQQFHKKPENAHDHPSLQLVPPNKEQ